MAFQISNLMSYATMTLGDLEHKFYLLLYSDLFSCLSPFLCGAWALSALTPFVLNYCTVSCVVIFRPEFEGLSVLEVYVIVK